MRLKTKVCFLLIALVVMTCMPYQVIALEPGELTLEEAINIAKVNNFGIRKLRLEVARTEGDIQALIDESIFGQQALALEALLKAQKENLESSLGRLEQTVEDAFNGVIALHRQIESQEENLRRIEQRHAAEHILVSHGLSTTAAVEVIALAIEKSRFGLDNLFHNLKVAYMNFNVLLARPVNTVLHIPVDNSEQAVEDLEFSPEDIDWNESLTRALTPKYGSLKNALDALSDAEKVYNDLAIQYNYFYFPKFNDYRYAKYPEVRQAKHTLELAKLNLEQAYGDMEISLRSTFRNVVSAARVVEITQQELDIERKNLLYAEKKHEVGLATQSAVIDQLNKVTACEIDLADKIYAYKRALLALRQAELGL